MTPLRAAAFLLALACGACGGDETPAPASFPPLTYGYLTKLSLNVGTIQVQDAHQPLGAADVAAQSPVPPAEALAQMARDRLFAAGTTGSAVFTIDQASLQREPGGAVDGALVAHLDVLGSAGNLEGTARMQVTRQHVPGSEDESEPAVLYSMTKQMLDDMNVELEYQIKRSLQAWLVPAGAVAAPVQAQPLESPPSEGGSAPPATGVPSALPPAVPPDGEAAPAPPMSPPPGFLHLPGQPES